MRSTVIVYSKHWQALELMLKEWEFGLRRDAVFEIFRSLSHTVNLSTASTHTLLLYFASQNGISKYIDYIYSVVFGL
jgi:hypothetical protein